MSKIAIKKVRIILFILLILMLSRFFSWRTTYMYKHCYTYPHYTFTSL